MKIIFSLCFAALCLTTHGQTAKPIYSRDAWLDYIANAKKIAQLEAKVKSIYLDNLEKKGLARLQGQAQKISSEQVYQIESDANKSWEIKTKPIQAEIDKCKLKQQEIENHYVMPTLGPASPNPIKQTKP
jgi:hypothetical protein